MVSKEAAKEVGTCPGKAQSQSDVSRLGSRMSLFRRKKGLRWTEGRKRGKVDKLSRDMLKG